MNRQVIPKVLILFLITLVAYFNVNAQLCQGSLGDPVVNITFGAGNNYGPPLGTGLTNYTNVSSTCPNDGSYSITNSSPGCFSSWHVLTEDHTPNDVNGFMMLVNAANEPSDFYVQKVDGLCSGTTYEFAAWIINVEKPFPCGGNPTKPNVTFKIETLDGTVLMTYETHDIPSTDVAIWKQYGAFFTMPQGITSVIIRMTNNAPGGCGNDLALDDITFRPCGAKVSSTINGNTSDQNICLGDQSSFTLTGSADPDNNTSYQWQTSTDSITWTDLPGASTNTYTRPAFTTAGTYFYRLSVSQSTDISIVSCRVSSNVLSIHVNAKPVPAASNNGPICEGTTLNLKASTGASYDWRGPANFSSNSQNPTINNVTINNAGKYYVTVTSDKLCVGVDSTTVTINKNPTVTISKDTINLCQGQSTVLTTVGQNATNYSWQPATTLSAANIASPIATPTDTTTYVVTGSNGVCISKDTVTVNTFKKPVANAGPDKELLEGSAVTLNGSASGTDISILWSPAAYLSATNQLTPQATPPRDTTYTLRVTSNKGCGTSSDNVIVRVFKKISIPNAFSPNGDGINDYWNIKYLGEYSNTDISVYNRYGKVVFTSRGAYKPWDGTYNGKILPMGTYYYVIDVKMGINKYSGWVLIAR